jgi:DNA-binding FrmR family transcriptional regulator
VQSATTEKPKVITALNRIRGQVEGIARMVEEGRDCPDILIQISAARSALHSVEASLLEDHVYKAIESSFTEDGVSRDEKISELIGIFKKHVT